MSLTFCRVVERGPGPSPVIDLEPRSYQFIPVGSNKGLIAWDVRDFEAMLEEWPRRRELRLGGLRVVRDDATITTRAQDTFGGGFLGFQV